MEPFVQAAAPAAQPTLAHQPQVHTAPLRWPLRANSATGMAPSIRSAATHKVDGAGKATPAVLLPPPAAVNQIPMALWAAAKIQPPRPPAPAPAASSQYHLAPAPVSNHPRVLHRHRHLQV